LERLAGGDFSAELGQAEKAAYGFLDALLDPWVLIQLALGALAVVAGIALGRAIELALEPRVRAIHGNQRLLRFLALLLRRTRWIVAVLLLAILALAIGVVSRPIHAAIVATAAELIAAWVAISVVSRLIRNRTAGRLVAWIAWIFVALRITGTFDQAASGLDLVAVRFGAFRISVYGVIQASVVIFILLWLAILLGNFLERRVAASSDLTPSLKVLVGKLAKIVLLVAAFGIALSALGIDLTALTVFTGALGVGIGIGLQKVISNFVSGLVILLDKSIKPGDTIALGNTFGWIKALRARFVSVVTRDGHTYLIPNEDFITQRVVNWSFTDTMVRVDVEFGVSYDSNPHDVRRIAVEAAKAVERVLGRPQPVCHLTKFGESSIDFVLRFWITDPQNGVTNVRGAVLIGCWDAFKLAGIEFPPPRREVVVTSPVEIQLRRGFVPEKQPELPLE
jgi:small-conductance mechanosensitive channel